MRWLALLLSFNQALWIDVPFIQQDKNGCGSAVIWMMLAYWKQEPAPSLAEIHQQVFSEKAGGVYARDMEAFLRARSFRTFAFKGEWKDLQDHVAKGRPLIVCLEPNARGVPLHYVVVAGVDPVQNLVLLNDPAQRKLLAMDRAAFEKAWSATDNWTLLAVPELDLAGQAFREEKHSEAKDHLNAALRLHPEDAYANEFLATVHFLENDIESALKYWNKLGKPSIENIQIDPPLKLKPALLDKAFAFSRGEPTLTLASYRTTQARLQATGLFSRIEMQLAPVENDRFDVVLRGAERNGLSMLSWFRGLPYETVYPAIYNIGGRAINIRSLIRWDDDRPRVLLTIGAPLRNDPKWRYDFALDVRQDDRFAVDRREASFVLTSVSSGRWTWSSGIAAGADRSDEQASGAQESGRGDLHGYLRYAFTSRQNFLRLPEKHLTVDTIIKAEAGKVFNVAQPKFAKFTAEMDMKWHGLGWRLTSGITNASTPSAEGFILGLDRDSELWLRATKDRLLTRRFVLSNGDALKTFYKGSIFTLRTGPFVDAALASGWLADAGLQLQVTALGALTANVSFGKNLRTGANVWFVNSSR